MSEYYDRDGQPMELMAWAQKFGDNDYKRIRYTEMGKGDDDPRVSTVWLGLNHQFGNGPPLIFETMIFGGKYNDYQWRYSTEAEASANHDRLVKALEGGEDISDV